MFYVYASQSYTSKEKEYPLPGMITTEAIAEVLRIISKPAQNLQLWYMKWKYLFKNSAANTQSNNDLLIMYAFQNIFFPE